MTHKSGFAKYIFDGLVTFTMEKVWREPLLYAKQDSCEIGVMFKGKNGISVFQ